MDHACGGSKVKATQHSQFIPSHYSPATFLLVVVANIVFNISIFSNSEIFVSSPLRSYTKFSFLSLSLAIRLVAFIQLGLIWLLKSNTGEQSHDVNFTDEKHNKKASRLQFMQCMYPFLMTMSLSIHILMELFDNTCTDTTLTAGALNKAVFAIKFYPLVTFFLLRDTDLKAIVGAWGSGNLIMLICAIKLQSRIQFAHAISFTFVSGVIFYDSCRQQKAMMMVVEKLQHTLELNEKLAVEAQALELRAMIGNVAHDFKTPLTSLLSGIECMTDMLTEWGQMLNNPHFEWTEEHIARASEGNIEMQAVLANMNSTNSFMTMTINRCLDYTKSTNGFKLVPKFETVSLQQALEMPVKLMQGAQHAVAIQMNAFSDDICSHIITDKQWLVENLLCLLSNAAKYSSKGTVTVDVFSPKLNADDISNSPRTRRAVTSSAPSGPTEYLRFEVQDTGVGLSDEAMQGLFNPFKQAQRLAGGTGLGLFSLAKRVEALYGQYGVMRRPDGEQGSVFWFTIPYRPDELTARSIEQRGGSFSRGLSIDMTEQRISSNERDTKGSGTFNVLVVDDAPLIVKMTTMLLQRKGHTVQHAVNGVDALEKLASVCDSPHDVSEVETTPLSLPFDVVLMDLQMPVLDGIEAIRRLRAAEDKQQQQQQQSRGSSLNGIDSGSGRGSDSSANGSARQFVIALSANSDEETRQEALTAGADAFMPKPFTYESFINTMQMQIKPS